MLPRNWRLQSFQNMDLSPATKFNKTAKKCCWLFRVIIIIEKKNLQGFWTGSKTSSTGPLLSYLPSYPHITSDHPSAIQLLPKEQKQEAIVCPFVSDQKSRTSEQTSSCPVVPPTQRCRQKLCSPIDSLERDWATAATHWLSKPPLILDIHVSTRRPYI